MSDLPLWGSLQKAQDDPETIEEAIARLIGEHESDPEAHLGEGESLEQHKTEGMIDHPAGSVATDKLPQARLVASVFESLDGWALVEFGTGSGYLNFPGVVLQTGATTNGEPVLFTGSDGFSNFDVSKSFFFKTTLRLSHAANQIGRFGIGALGGGDGTCGVGFRFENSTLYAYVEDEEVVTSYELTGISLTDAHVYEVRYDIAEEIFRWYVDGLEVKTLAQALVDTASDILFGYRIKTTTGANRNMYVADLVVQLDL